MRRMIELQFVLDCATTVLTAVLCFLMLFNKYEIKQKAILLKIVSVFAVITAKMGIAFLGIPPLNFISSFLMSLFIIYIIYQCRLKTALVYSFLFLMIALVADALGILIVSAAYHYTITETLKASNLIWHHHMWNWIMQIFLSRASAVIIRSKYNLSIKWHEILFYLLLLLFETLVFASVSSAIQDYMSGQFLIIMMTGFLILDVYIIYILNKVSSSRESEQKIRLMQQQELLHLQMYEELRKKYNETCEVAHDINRHISSLKGLLETNQNKQAEEYLSDLSEETVRLKPTIRNQNSMLEIILNTILTRCEKENIDLKLNVEDFPMPFISDMDMTTIFSNLFDNAIDACLEISKSQRKIHAVLRVQMGLIVFRIKNSCRETEPEKLHYRHSTKANHSGIGLSNVKKAVEKYDGILNVNQEENQFCVSITFTDKI